MDKQHLELNPRGGKLVFELVDCTNVLLNEIANPGLYRKDVAQTYRMALCSSYPTDWKAVNKAIIRRWSISTLDYIKRLAWKGMA